jgi:hypothetical protein
MKTSLTGITFLAVTIMLITMLSISSTTTVAEAQELQRLPGATIIPPSNTTTTFVDDTGLTVQQLPPGWSVIDRDNTSPNAIELARYLGSARIADFCPPGSEAIVQNPGTVIEDHGCDPIYGTVWAEWHLNLGDSQNDSRVIAEDIINYTTNPLFDRIVEDKTILINITYPENGTSWQVPGSMALFANPLDLNLTYIGLYFVDYTTGYSMRVNGPSGSELVEPSRQSVPDPRGEAIEINGIDLEDNLPPIFDDAIQIMESVRIHRE